MGVARERCRVDPPHLTSLGAEGEAGVGSPGQRPHTNLGIHFDYYEGKEQVSQTAIR